MSSLQSTFIGLFLVFAQLLSAQTTATGSLSGKLTDTSGAAVVNATVTATNADTSQARIATTGADGGYLFTACRRASTS